MSLGEEMKNLRAHIVVVGGGGAGMAAARAAAEKGARVIVLEKHGPGGSSAMAFGIYASESNVQKRLKIHGSNDDFFRDIMEWSHWRINPLIVRAIIEKSADTIRWLEEKGLEFDCLPYISYPGEQENPTWHVPVGGGAALIKSLVQTSESLGVHILKQSPANKILVSKSGEITGVLAETKGQEFIVKTGCVIIATGGFGGNKELLKKYCPEYKDNTLCFGILNMGEGLSMATELGAATEGLGNLMMMGPLTFGMLATTVSTPPDTKQLILQMQSLMDRRSLWVNKLGKRFIDESLFNHHIMSHTVARQPEAFAYTILDSKLAWVIASEQEHPSAVQMPRSFHGGPRRLSAEEAERYKDPLKISDSWEEIAQWIGADAGVLKTTVDEYNAACEKGYDTLLGKDRQYLIPLRTPPYYVIRWYPVFSNTSGGIKVNESMKVVNHENRPIPGVYAAGVDTGGWTSESYCIKLSGWAFGYAVNSGRIAGENAVEYIKSLAK
jgi:fumarate reductase flavoprotein subunit